MYETASQDHVTAILLLSIILPPSFGMKVNGKKKKQK